MKSNWIAALGLLVAFGGCRTVHQPLVTSNHQAVESSVATQSKWSRQNVAVKSEHAVRHVGFQQDDSDSETNHQSQAGLITLVQNPDQNLDGVGKVYSLVDLEQMALSNNPALSAAQSSVEKSAGLYRQVGTRPNPTLGYSANQLADQSTDQHTIFMEQEFVRGNKLALNRQVLRHTNDAQRWELETQRHRILTDIRVRFYEAIAAQHALDATLEFSEVASRGLEFAEKLQEAGEGTLVDVLQSKTLMSETILAQEQAEAAYRGAWKELVAIAGMPALQLSRLNGDLETTGEIFDWQNTYSVIAAESPELSAANAIVCEKLAFLKRQRVQMIPNLTAQLGAGYDRSTDSGLINFQVGAPIPVRNKNCGNIAAAQADYHRAVENVRRIELSIKARLARAAQEFESASASVEKYKQEILPQVDESLEYSEKAYEAGELAFLQVLVVRRNFYDSTIKFIQAQGRLAQVNAKIEGLLLTGGLDAPRDFTDGDGLRGQSFDGQ